MARKLRFGRYGMQEDPREQVAVWTAEGREQIARVTGFYQKHIAAGDYRVLMLTTRFFCGDTGPDVPARDVMVLEEEHA